MKWAIIGIVAVVVLGGIGYLVYELTDTPERLEQAWDEARLNNFEALANRELNAYQKKIEEYEATLNTLKRDHIQWAGHPDWDRNTETQPHGFKTALGYDIEIAFLTQRGRTLAAAYREAGQSDGAPINADTGRLEDDFTISANVLGRADRAVARALAEGTDVAEVNFPSSVREISAGDIRNLLFEIEERLVEYEGNRERIASIAAEYEASIKEWEEVVANSKNELQEMRREVSRIAAEIKLQQAREDLDELNRSIRGESTESRLGTMIHNFERRRSDFERGQLVSADEKASATPQRLSLDDLDSPSTSAPARSSRFLD
jgi:hypothetical protein